MTVLICRKHSGRRKPDAITPLALVFNGHGETVTTRVANWGERSAAILHRIAKSAAESGRNEGRELPLSSLRVLLQATIPEAAAVHPKLGLSRGSTVIVEAPVDDLRDRVIAALDIWITGELASWASRLDVPEALVDALREAVEDVSITRIAAPLDVPADLDFPALRRPLMTLIGRLAGTELFPGMGPVKRVIGRDPTANTVEFETAPAAGPDGAQFSMVARLALVTLPGAAIPALTVAAVRRRWCTALPERLYGVRRLGMRIAARLSPVAITAEIPVRKGEPTGRLPAEFLVHAIAHDYDFTRPLGEMIAEAGATDPVFVGLAHSPRYGGHPIGSGTTTRDNLDLFDVVADALAPLGFAPLVAAETVAPAKWDEEYHKVLGGCADLVAETAYALGHNCLSETSLAAALDTFLGEGDHPTIDHADAEAARANLQRLRDANAVRLRRLYDAPPVVVVVAARAEERTRLERLVALLYGDAVHTHPRALPDGAHSPRDAAAPQARFERRVKAWRPLAEEIAAAFDNPRVLIQAPMFMDGRRDDPVSKAAGRHALAVAGGANVQFLLPPFDRGWRALNAYLIRLQAALGDLLFAHSGGLDDIGELMAETFPDCAAPDCLLGISVVSRQERRGGTAAKVAVAILHDCRDRRTYARLGHESADARWQPLADILRLAASLSAPTLGDSREAERRCYQTFVADVLASLRRDHRCPLVLFDATAAAGLWPWLANPGLAGPPLIGAEALDVAAGWDGLRLVRVRVGEAPRLVGRKNRIFTVLETDGSAEHTLTVPAPTIVPATLRLPSTLPVYWATGDYLEQLPRGLSVYRTGAAQLKPAALRARALPAGTIAIGLDAAPALVDKPYRLPSTIEIAVARCAAGDDPDRIAAMIAALRTGLSHTDSATTLPAPLSFAAKLSDYLVGFALEAAAEDEDEDEADAPPDDAPTATDAALTQLEVDVEFDGLSAALRCSTASPVALGHERGQPPSRDPVLPVPNFVDADFIRRFMALPPAAIAHITDQRKELRRLSGFANWPAARPGWNEVCRLIVEGLRYPAFMRALTRIAYSTWSSHERRQEFHPWNPVRTEINRITDSSDAEPFDVLIERGDLDLARAYAFAHAHLYGPLRGELRATIARCPEESELAAFADAAEQHLAFECSWKADIFQGDTDSAWVARPDDVPAAPERPPLPDAADRIMAQPSIHAIETAMAVVTPPPATATSIPASAPVSVDEDAVMTDSVSAAPRSAAERKWYDIIETTHDLARLGPPSENVPATFERAAAELRIVLREIMAEKLQPTDTLLARLSSTTALLADYIEVPAYDFAVARRGLAEELWRLVDELLARAEAAVAEAERLDGEARSMRPRERAPVEVARNDRVDEAATACNKAWVLLVGPEEDEAEAEADASAVTVPMTPTSPDVVADAIDATSTIAAERASDATVEDEEGSEGKEEAESAAVPNEAPPCAFETTITAEPNPALVDDYALVVDDFAVTGAGEDVDERLERVVERIDAFICSGEIGAAYHLLVAAGAVFGAEALPWTTTELRLAAGIVGDLSWHERNAATRALTEATDIAHHLISVDECDDERGTARRVMLTASVLEAACFDVGEEARTVIDVLSANSVGNCFYKLSEAILNLRYGAYRITPAALAALRADEAAEAHRANILTRLETRIVILERTNIAVTSGNRVKSQLFSPTVGAVATLRAGLGTPEAARATAAFAERFPNWETALSHVYAIDSKLDGRRRDRIVQHLVEIASLCSEYTEAARPVAADPHIKTMQNAIVAGIDSARRSLTHLAEGYGRLVGAAVRHANGELDRLSRIFAGQPVSRDRFAVARILHAPLLWAPGLHFAGSWLPSPYEPGEIIRLLTETDLPLVPTVVDAATLSAGVEARKREGSFIAATLLAQFGESYGLDADTAEALRRSVAGDIDSQRENLRQRKRQVVTLLDKVGRIGYGAVDAVAAREAEIEAIDCDRLPIDADLDGRSEEAEDGRRIADFGAAHATLNRIERHLREMLEGPRTEIVNDFNQLRADGLIDDGHARNIEALLTADDLPTAREWLDFLRDPLGRHDVRGAGDVNPELNDLLAVIEAIKPTAETKVALPEVARAVASGQDHGPLRFSALSEARRGESAAVLDAWIEMRRQIETVPPDPRRTSDLIQTLLTRLGIRVDGRAPEASNRNNPHRRLYVSDFMLSIAGDARLLLPDFGTDAKGRWRVAVRNGAPSEDDLSTIMDADDDRVVLFLCLDAMTVDARDHVRRQCAIRRKRVLVIDTMLLLFMLAQDEYRPLGLVEIAQAFTWAAPYADRSNSPVPPEIFKGRREERGELTARNNGKYIVYGGRRLGKTALLLSIQKNPPEDTVAGYAFMRDSGRRSDADKWAILSAGLPEVFAKPAATAEDFRTRVLDWLGRNPGKRLLLMIDEADIMIEEDSRNDYAMLASLQKLMTDSSNDFKFVLAGLHNLARLHRENNSPLGYLDSEAINIGPLLRKDLSEAEMLVRGPMAALGFEFEDRADVWRILSMTNYFPIMIHVFCGGLLDKLFRQVGQRGQRNLRVITSRVVEEAIADGDVLNVMRATFEKTLKLDGGRYMLLACVLAARILFESPDGEVPRGMTTTEILAEAAKWWPEAFGGNGATEVQVGNLLDEMVGLGVLRQTNDRRWTFRSHTLLTLIGNSEDVYNELASFRSRPAVELYDPKLRRREVGVKRRNPMRSPLTQSEERTVLALRERIPVQVIFGTPAADVNLVATALDKAGQERGNDTVIVHVNTRWQNADTLIRMMRTTRVTRPRHVFVVSPGQAWTPQWVTEAHRVAALSDRNIGAVFIGDASHALRWAETGGSLTARVQVRTLASWTQATVATHADDAHVSDSPLAIIEATAGASALIQRLLPDLAANKGRAAFAELDAHIVKEGFSGLLGLPDELQKGMQDLLRVLLEAYGPSVSLSEFRGLMKSACANPDLETERLRLLGLIRIIGDDSTPNEHRTVEVSPLLALIAKSGGAV